MSDLERVSAYRDRDLLRKENLLSKTNQDTAHGSVLRLIVYKRRVFDRLQLSFCKGNLRYERVATALSY